MTTHSNALISDLFPAPRVVGMQPSDNPAEILGTVISGRLGHTLRIADGGRELLVGGIDTIVGGNGHDEVTLLDGGPVSVSRVEYVRGSTDRDEHVILGNLGNDITTHAINKVTGGRGYDVVTLRDNTYVTMEGVERVIGTGYGVDQITLTDKPANITVSDIESVYGGAGDDYIAANPVNLLDDIFGPFEDNGVDLSDIFGKTALLHGGAGDDTLVGGSGVDTLVGGEGRNVMYAGEGDTVYTESGLDVVELQGGEVTVMLDPALYGEFESGVQLLWDEESGRMGVWTEFGEAPILTLGTPGENASVRIVGVSSEGTFETTFSFDAETDLWSI